MAPKRGYSNKIYAVRGMLRGHEGEWYRVNRKGTHNLRVVKVGPEGRSVGVSYRVRAEDFTEIGGAPETAAAPKRELSIVGQRGSVTLSANLRERLGIGEGDVVIQEERAGGILILAADVNPRARGGAAEGPQPALEELLAEMTPETLHEEVDFGPPVGRELL
jgi:bifunctional DNA-binding transcriptional regulator/antitoxin component of YhaV-PrlF toxin-antitoxin module